MSFHFIPYLLVAIAALYFWKATRSVGKLPNGPPGLPIIGNWSDLRGAKPHLKLTEWSRKFGDFYSYRLGTKPVIVLSSPETLTDLFEKNGNVYSSRPFVSNQSDLCTNNQRLVALRYGDDWRRLRKIVHALLGVQNSSSFKPYQEYESRVMLANLLELPQSFYGEMSRFSGSVTFSLLLGARFSTLDHPIVEQINQNISAFLRYISPGTWLVDWIPVLDNLPEMLAPWRQKARDIHNNEWGYWMVLYRRIQERVIQGSAPDCFAARLVEEQEQGHCSEGDAAGLMATLLSAGTDTTAGTLQWLFKAATIDQSFIRVAQEELDQVVGRERLPGWDDQARLPYIEAVLKEIHRWSSMVLLAIAHATSEPDTYRGSEIPAGTIVISNTYAIHHDAKVFEAHDKFLPERYFPRDDPRCAVDAAKIDTHFAFGTGRRVCPGRLVADTSLYLSISRLLWAFNIGPKPGAEIDVHKIAHAGPISSPAKFECVIEPRTPKIADVIRAAVKDAEGAEMEDLSNYTELLRSNGYI